MSILLPDEHFLQTAKILIRDAKREIYIATFKVEITTKPRGRHLVDFFEILAKKVNDRLDVRVITNEKNNLDHVPDTNTYAIRWMKCCKIPVRYLPNNRLCHAKILIVDGYRAILGSHNLSVKSCHNNLEMSYLLTDQTDIESLWTFYEAIWSKAKKV